MGEMIQKQSWLCDGAWCTRSIGRVCGSKSQVELLFVSVCIQIIKMFFTYYFLYCGSTFEQHIWKYLRLNEVQKLTMFLPISNNAFCENCYFVHSHSLALRIFGKTGLETELSLTDNLAS